MKNVFDGDAYTAKRSNRKLNEPKPCSCLKSFSYSCGSSLNDIHCFEDDEDTVLAKLQTSIKLTCNSQMEVSYYGVFREEPLCYHCGKATIFPENPDNFPICEDCHEKGLKLQQNPQCSTIHKTNAN